MNWLDITQNASQAGIPYSTCAHRNRLWVLFARFHFISNPAITGWSCSFKSSRVAGRTPGLWGKCRSANAALHRLQWDWIFLLQNYPQIWPPIGPLWCNSLSLFRVDRGGVRTGLMGVFNEQRGCESETSKTSRTVVTSQQAQNTLTEWCGIQCWTKWKPFLSPSMNFSQCREISRYPYEFKIPF